MASKDKLTKHHVPPKHPDKEPRFIKRKSDRHHRAYHLLFGNPRSFAEAAEILKKEWWEGAKIYGRDKKKILMKKWTDHAAYNLLFGAAASYEMAAEILEHDWWKPPHPQVCSY